MDRHAALLIMGSLFGVLLLTGTTIRELPDTLYQMFGTRGYEEGYDGEGYDGEGYDGEGHDADGYDDGGDTVDASTKADAADDFSDGYYDDPTAL